MPYEKPLQVGVLIIGSLYWDERRETWRNCRLTHDVYDVPARIRYGRQSEKRGNSYTMVFSQLAGEGRAKIVRCRHAISKSAHLIEEAEHLWAAECLRQRSDNVSSTWGCVALLCNPSSRIPPDLQKQWCSHVDGRPGYRTFGHAQHETPSVSDDGRLQISWPTVTMPQSAEPLDLLVATANFPSIVNGAYPGLEEIARGWVGKDNYYVEYFRKNRASGITTFEDDEISRLLNA